MPITNVLKKKHSASLLSRNQRDLIRHAWETIEYLRKDEGLTKRAFMQRMGMHHNHKEISYNLMLWRDMKLSTLASLLHLMGKKVRFVIEDEV